MATLTVNDELLSQAVEVGGFSSTIETVNQALADFIYQRKAKALTGMFGTIEYDDTYDYKAARNYDFQKATVD